MKILRGERILAQLLEQSSYNKLYGNIQNGFPETNKRQNATNEVKVLSIKYTPVRITGEGGALRIAATTRSVNQHEYQQQILFSDVSFVGDGQSSTSFTASDNTKYNIVPINLNNSRVRVKCSCLDFHHRFAVWNYNDQSLMGKRPPLYQRKTNTRPPVNPMKVPGLCKHLIKVFDDMQRQGLLAG